MFFNENSYDLCQANISQIDPSRSSHKELFNLKIEEQLNQMILEERIANLIKEDLVKSR